MIATNPARPPPQCSVGLNECEAGNGTIRITPEAYIGKRARGAHSGRQLEAKPIRFHATQGQCGAALPLQLQPPVLDKHTAHTVGPRIGLQSGHRCGIGGAIALLAAGLIGQWAYLAQGEPAQMKRRVRVHVPLNGLDEANLAEASSVDPDSLLARLGEAEGTPVVVRRRVHLPAP